MSKFSVLSVAVFAGVFAVAGSARAELLANPNLDSPGTHDSDLIDSWTLIETRTGLPAENSATFASFANHNAGGTVGLWYRSFHGTLANPVHADLIQDVVGSAGTPYILTAWSRFETNFPSGVAGDVQDSLLALEFLDAGTSVIGGTVKDLAADGQSNDGVWRKHSITASAPAGTSFVRVRASLLNGHAATANPQSGFMDEFSLNVVPEPASLTAVAAAGLALLKRRRA